MKMMLTILKRKIGNEKYLDFVYEAENFIRKKDKEFLKKKVKKMKPFYTCFFIKKRIVTTLKT